MTSCRYKELVAERKAWLEKIKASPDTPFDGFTEESGEVVPARLIYLSKPSGGNKRWCVEERFLTRYPHQHHVWPTPEGVYVEAIRIYSKRRADAEEKAEMYRQKKNHWADKWLAWCDEQREEAG